MRTTVTLDEQLLARLKRRASETGSSVSELIEQGVRLLMRKPSRAADAGGFELVTFGAGASFTKRNVDKTSALLEEDDVRTYGGER
jgi:hypothetical protein